MNHDKVNDLWGRNVRLKWSHNADQVFHYNKLPNCLTTRNQALKITTSTIKRKLKLSNSKRFSVCHYTVGVKFNFLKFWSSLFGINVCQTIKRRVYLYTRVCFRNRHPLKVVTNIRFENICLGNWLAVCTKTPNNPFTKRIFA